MNNKYAPAIPGIMAAIASYLVNATILSVVRLPDSAT